MTKTIIIKDIPTNEIQGFYDETPTNEQLPQFFNQCISKLNGQLNINLPLVIDKSGQKPDAIDQESWDSMIDTNGTYVIDDNWVRRIIVPFIGFRVMYIEEGANAGETSEPYADFMEGMRELNAVRNQVIPSEYIKIAGVISGQEDESQKGNVFVADLGTNPFGGNF